MQAQLASATATMQRRSGERGWTREEGALSRWFLTHWRQLLAREQHPSPPAHSSCEAGGLPSSEAPPHTPPVGVRAQPVHQSSLEGSLAHPPKRQKAEDGECSPAGLDDSGELDAQALAAVANLQALAQGRQAGIGGQVKPCCPWTLEMG